MRTWQKVILASAAVGSGLVLLLAKSQPPSPPFVVVVLGISDVNDALDRVAFAHAFVDRNNVSRIIFSGHGDGIDGQTEAAWMADAFGQTDIPISIEDASYSTAGNVDNVAMLVQPTDRVVFVSNHWHAKAAAYCLAKAHGIPETFWCIDDSGYASPMDEDDLLKYCERGGCCI